MPGIVVAAPLRLEALLIRSAVPGAHVHRTGMGPVKSRSAAQRLRAQAGPALLVLGFCGGLDEQSQPGEVVVADVLRAAEDEGHRDQPVSCAGSAELAGALAAAGLNVRRGALVCVSRLALGERRAQLAAAGALAVDMESIWLAAGAGERPLGVARVVLDAPNHELLRPAAALAAVRAAAVLRRAAAAALQCWRPEGLR